MFNFKRTTALVGAAAVLAVPTAVLVSSPAQADVEKSGSCGAGIYEFSVDREGKGFEIDAGLENVEPGSRWRITLKQDGDRFYRGVQRADFEGDLDVDRYRGNTPGNDTMKFRANRVGGAGACGATITVS